MAVMLIFTKYKTQNSLTIRELRENKEVMASKSFEFDQTIMVFTVEELKK